MPKPPKRRCSLSEDSWLRQHKRLKELSDDETLTRKENNRLRMAEKRKTLSENDLQARRASDRLRYSEATKKMMDAEIQTRREHDRVRRAQAREQMTEKETQIQREADRVRIEVRESMPGVEIQIRREGDRDRLSQTREAMNEQEREEYRAAQRERERVERRDHRRVKNRGFIARRVPEFVTLPIEQSYFGSLNDPNSTITCSSCGAVKFEAHQNRHSSCCNKGLINIPMFPNHPEAFRALWENVNPKYRIVKKHVRALNNTMAMASLQANAAPVPGGGYTPTVVIQGKTYARMGPLIPDDGESPLFSQLYVLDPSMQAPEEEIRFQNMSLPASTPETEKNVLRQVIVTCQHTLTDCNPYVKDFKTAAEIARETNPEALFIRIDDTKRPTNDHARRYNAGTQEISVLTDDEIANCQKDRALVVRLKGGGLREVQDTHRSADALQFPLLFPYGTDGWHMGLRKSNGKPITGLEFYSFHIQTRFSPGSLQVAPSPDLSLLRMGKLTHVYFCFSQSRIENQRLKFIAHNQKELRGASYKRICEDVHAHRNNETAGALKSGEQVILPPSFVGSPRYYHNHFHDAMAICRKFHKPDFFITFTCNPYWKEIVESLLPGQIPADRPDIMADVFHIKLKELMKLLKDGYLGCVAAHMHVIEFQKRGLPHAHILLILKNENRILTAEEVDEIISAEIPPDPMSYPEGPQRQRAEELQDIVLQNMIHTCGPRCQRDGDQGIVQNQPNNDSDTTNQPTPRVTSPRQCTKGYPKQFCSKTEWEDNAFHPIYRRRGPDEGGRQVTKGAKTIDNRSVVPYSPILSWMFKAHINVELCVSPTCAKYLFKYCTKGPDRAMASVGYNEVDDFQNFRSLGASEAVWKLRQYDVTDRYPAVTALRIHLPGENYVIYEEGTEEEVVGRGEKRTELDAFFAYNAAHPGTEYKYVDFPTHFVLKNRKEWTERKRNKDGGMIGRIHVVHPVHSPETFCLRILLNDDHCIGKTSFDDLRTVNGDVLETYKQVCERLGHPIKEESNYKRHHFRVDCSHSSIGIFAGILFVMAAVISMIMFLVKIHLESTIDALWIFYLSDSAFYIITTGVCIAALVRMRVLPFMDPENAPMILLDDILLFIGLSGQLIFNLFTIVSMNDITLLSGVIISVSLLSIVQVVFQTFFILAAQRLRVLGVDLHPSKEENWILVADQSSAGERKEAEKWLAASIKKKPGRQMVAFLLVANLGFFIINTFESQKATTNPVMMKFYGQNAWAVIVHAAVPLVIFYRFHSSVCLAEIWKISYAKKKQNVQEADYNPYTITSEAKEEFLRMRELAEMLY